MRIKTYLNSRIKRFLSIAFISIFVVAILSCLYIKRQRIAFAKRNHCVGNLIGIRLAKDACQADLKLPVGSQLPYKALDGYFNEIGKSFAEFKCPEGGIYSIGNAGSNPCCSYTGICYSYNIKLYPMKYERLAWRHSIQQ